MLTPLLLLVPVSIGVTWLVAQGIANAPFDRALEHNLRPLARLVMAQQDQTTPFVLPPSAREILRADDADRVYYQVFDSHGTLLGGEPDVPRPNTDEPPVAGAVSLHDGEMHGQPVRVASLWQASGNDDDAPLVLLQMAETREKQSVLAAEIIKGVLLPQFAIL